MDIFNIIESFKYIHTYIYIYIYTHTHIYGAISLIKFGLIYLVNMNIKFEF